MRHTTIHPVIGVPEGAGPRARSPIRSLVEGRLWARRQVAHRRDLRVVVRLVVSWGAGVPRFPCALPEPDRGSGSALL
jgi:hypothetical protein